MSLHGVADGTGGSSPWSHAVVRTLSVLLCLFAVGIVGLLQRSPWTAFCVAVAATLITYPAHPGVLMKVIGAIVLLSGWSFIAGLLYVVGFGAGSLFTGERAIAPFETGDIVFGSLVLIAAGIVAVKYDSPEESLLRRRFESSDEDDEPNLFEMLGMEPRDMTVALERDHGMISPRRIFEPRGAQLPATDDEIEEAQERLGFVLPDSLRRIYQTQNGGETGQLMVPLRSDPEPVGTDFRWAIPGHWWMKLEELVFLEDHPSWTPPCHSLISEGLIEDAGKLVVLAECEGDYALLDTGTRNGEGVVVHSFAARPPKAQTRTYETFDAFLYDMVRYEDE